LPNQQLRYQRNHHAKDSCRDEAQQQAREHATQVILHDERSQIGHPAPFEILEDLIGGQHLLLPGGTYEGVIC
jgi:hypothetical protein